MDMIESLIDRVRSKVELLTTLEDSMTTEIARSIHNDINSLRKFLKEHSTMRVIEKSYAFDTIRNLAGFIQDGSHSAVAITQDDATGDWIARVQDKTVGRNECLIQALKEAKSKTDKD